MFPVYFVFIVETSQAMRSQIFHQLQQAAHEALIRILSMNPCDEPTAMNPKEKV
jgi:hypothetical protein